MLSSRMIRTVTLLLIGFAFLNMVIYMLRIYPLLVKSSASFQSKYFNDPMVFDKTPDYGSKEVSNGSGIYAWILLHFPHDNASSTTKTVYGISTSGPHTSTENLTISTLSKTSNIYTSDIEQKADFDVIAPVANVNTTTIMGSEKNEHEHLCPEIPPNLGRFIGDAKSFDKIKGNISFGGYHRYKACKPRRKIAIIVPVRFTNEFKDHVKFIQNLHEFLVQQQVEYQVFLVGQNNSAQEFTRGRLINVGFIEVHRRYPQYHCFIIHAPNLVPLDTRNLYRCSWYPRQLAVTIEKADKSIIVPKFGEVVALTVEQMSEANGFSNVLQENADYSDMYDRLLAANYVIEKSPISYGKYMSLYCLKYNTNKMLSTRSMKKLDPIVDGISSLAYTESTFELRTYYTYISVSFPDDRNIFAKTNPDFTY